LLWHETDDALFRVIPAKAGIQRERRIGRQVWIPAFAEMTSLAVPSNRVTL
jgi:hypothetical protein